MDITLLNAVLMPGDQLQRWLPQADMKAYRGEDVSPLHYVLGPGTNPVHLALRELTEYMGPKDDGGDLSWLV